MASDDNFLSRWSRRKRLVEEERAAEQAAAESPVDEAAGAEAEASLLVEDAELDEESAEPHPTELIDIEALTRESDFTVFMKKGVPAAVKQKALRKLWTTDPVFANLDGLNDYDVNVDLMNKAHGFKAFSGSSWQVGKGFSWMDEVADKVAELGQRVGDIKAEPDVRAEPGSDGASMPEGDEAEENEKGIGTPETGEAEEGDQTEKA